MLRYVGHAVIRRLFLLALLLACVPAFAVGAYVQVNPNAAVDSAGTTIASGTWGSSVAAGNAQFYFVVYYRSAGAVTVTVAGNSNTYVESGNAWDTTNDVGIAWGYAKNVNSGTTGSTATYSSSVEGGRGIVLVEYSGLEASGTLVGESVGTNDITFSAAANNFTTGNATPSYQPSVVIAMGYNIEDVSDLSVGTGYTQRSTVLNFGYGGTQGLLEDQRITSLSALAGTWTSATGGYGVAAMMVARESGSGSALPANYYRRRRH